MGDIVHEDYLKEENVKLLSEMFKKGGANGGGVPSVSLGKFLLEKVYGALKERALCGKFHLVNKPMHYHYGESFLDAKSIAIFSSGVVKEIIEKVLGVSIKKIDFRLLCFTWKDYTILHDGDSSGDGGYELLFDLSDEWNERAGGYVVYTDGKGESCSVGVGGNTLTLVKRKKGVERFVKYVNHYGDGKQRYIVIGKIEV